MSASAHAVVADLRERIRQFDGRALPDRAVLPFGVPDIDGRLPGGGLALASLHEICGGSEDAVEGTAAMLFAAGIAARTRGQVLWCLTQPDLFAPALAQAGLAPGRVVYAEAGDEKSLLLCFEEGLRHGGLGAVVAEVTRLSMTASRRLQLAAEAGGTLGIALRRLPRGRPADVFALPSAAVTRWRVSLRPSAPLPVPGIGRARWLLQLVRCRAGEAADFDVEASDAEGRIALSSGLADRSPAADAWSRSASA
ncbi:ImuA family protein [Shinella sp. G-2]|uniref:ImuA family protein n=1 Tax=Shinella sp. G-2 TaxID=3133141 RepID=UPI003D0050CC